MNKFEIVLGDPPWLYNARNNPNTKFGTGAHKYPLLKTSDICNIPVNEITADNAACILWVTWPRLPDGLKVLEAWGFSYKTVAFVWIKTNKNNDEPFFGIGYYARSNTEVALLGIKGKMKPASNKVSQLIFKEEKPIEIVAPRMEHSSKPLVTYEKIDTLFGRKENKVELFARNTMTGWTSIGNEIDGKDIREAIIPYTNLEGL